MGCAESLRFDNWYEKMRGYNFYLAWTKSKKSYMYCTPVRVSVCICVKVF